MARVLSYRARRIVHSVARPHLAGALLLAALLILQGAGAAFAGSGSFTVANRIPRSQAQPYCGRYTLAQAPPASHIRGSSMVIRMNAQGTLTGMLQVYGQDAQHYPAMWVVTLSDFRLATKGQMMVDLLGQDSSIQFGRLTFTRNARGDLSGWINLGAHGYPMRWRRLASH